MIHTVKAFGIVNKAEIDVFLELSCFFNDPVDVCNLISETYELWKKLMDLKSRLTQSMTCSQIEVNQFMFEHYRYKKR